MAIEFRKSADQERFIDDILSLLTYTYFDSDKNPIQGDAISSVLNQMRMRRGGKGWVGIGALSDFETVCKKVGFEIRVLKNSRGQKARVVTLQGNDMNDTNKLKEILDRLEESIQNYVKDQDPNYVVEDVVRILEDHRPDS